MNEPASNGTPVKDLYRAISYRMVNNRMKRIENRAVLISPADYIEVCLEYHEAGAYCKKLVSPRTLMGMQVAHSDEVEDGKPLVTNARGLKDAQIAQEERLHGKR